MPETPRALLRAGVGYFSNVNVLSREEFDAIEFDAAGSGEHLRAAQEMTRLADSAAQTDGMPRAEAYVRAGEQWLLADDPEAAAVRFRRAIEDGGPSQVEPRVPYARALFMLGRDHEAEDLIRELGSQPPRDARLCDLVAELLVEREDLPQALAWANAGVRCCLGQSPGPVGPGSRDGAAAAHPPDSQRNGERAARNGSAVDPVAVSPGQISPGDEAELRLLLSLRFRIRNDLGLPEDEYDRLLDRLPTRHA